MIENEVIKAIRERRSIRRFANEQITDEELQTILEAGTWAATGKGLQDPWIVAVQNEHQCRQLREMNAANNGRNVRPLLWCAHPYLCLCLTGLVQQHARRQLSARQHDACSPCHWPWQLLD